MAEDGDAPRVVYKACELFGFRPVEASAEDVVTAERISLFYKNCKSFGFSPTPATLDNVPDGWKLPCNDTNRAVERGRCVMQCDPMTEYISQPLTDLTDRECAPYTNCDPEAEYESRTPTPTSDRNCESFSPPCDLAEGRYQSRPPTPVSDRVCTAVSPPCDPAQGTYESQPPSAVTDRVCTAVSPPCDLTQDTYESQPPTAVSDRVCTAVSPSCDLTTHFESQPPTPTSDRACQVLAPSGTFVSGSTSEVVSVATLIFAMLLGGYVLRRGPRAATSAASASPGGGSPSKPRHKHNRKQKGAKKAPGGPQTPQTPPATAASNFDTRMEPPPRIKTVFQVWRVVRALVGGHGDVDAIQPPGSDALENDGDSGSSDNGDAWEMVANRSGTSHGHRGRAKKCLDDEAPEQMQSSRSPSRGNPSEAPKASLTTTTQVAYRPARAVAGRFWISRAVQSRPASDQTPSGSASAASAAVLSKFESAVATALCIGPNGLAGFKSNLLGLRAPPSLVPTLRLTLLRIATGSLLGISEQDQRLVQVQVNALLNVLYTCLLEPRNVTRDALFFPSNASKARLLRYIQSAKVSCDVCVFTITDDEIAESLLHLHRDGRAKVRIISDDEQAVSQKGSAIFRLASAGIPTLVDEEILRPSGRAQAPSRVERNMHNKFCIVDHALLVTGSFNWTRAAATRNVENCLVTACPAAVAAYAAEFDRLWALFKSTLELSHHSAAARIQAICRGREARGIVSPRSVLHSPEEAQARWKITAAGQHLRRKSMNLAAMSALTSMETTFETAVDDILEEVSQAVSQSMACAAGEGDAGDGNGGAGAWRVADGAAILAFAGDEALLTLQRVHAVPAQASTLRETTLRCVASYIAQQGTASPWDDAQASPGPTPKALAAAAMQAGAAVLGSIEATLYQPPTFKDFLFFGPRLATTNTARERLLAYLGRASRTCDVAIFTLTDDRIRDALLALHKRKVKVRIISDNETALNSSSDLLQLAEAGVATVVDCDLKPCEVGINEPSPKGKARRHPRHPGAACGDDGASEASVHRHMHHKFCIVDGALLITGSFNFTYAASSVNHENLLCTDDSFFVQRYSAEFEREWSQFWGTTYEDTTSHQQAVVMLQALHRGRVARRRSVAMRRQSLHITDQGAFPALGAS